MADQTAWKISLSFSERFSAITQIANALTSYHGIDSAEAIKTAQAVENDYLNRAFSHDEYTALWRNELFGIISNDKGEARPYSPDSNNSLHDAIPSLGPYTRPTYHADGVNSTVYKSIITPEHCNFPTPSEHPTPPGLAVALKVTTPSSLTPPHDAYSEAKILNSILPHETILPLLETFVTPSTSTRSSHFVLVSPFYPYSLANLPSKPQGDSGLIQRILRDTFSALDHLHKHGIIHRDIKPSNILLSHPPSSSRAYLADFGIAWSAPTHAKAAEPPGEKMTDIGTTHYRAIEVLFGYREYGTELDLWSLGCVVAECFSNELGGEHWEPFFDAGDLGSELRLIASIFQKLGTPTAESWPGSSRLPDFGKIQFKDFPKKSWEELLPNAPEAARDIVDKLLRYEGSERITAAEALGHPLFAS
ncbi:kinase-like domain-containing protein [Tirmania nivea]|nr:kinase-like domain-containing protein [Tirmania nivea]